MAARLLWIKVTYRKTQSLGYTQRTGNDAELRACQYLTEQGLELIERNFHCRYGEIDLIMREQQTIVFVEVRFRKANSLVNGAQSITSGKQTRLVRSASYYLQQHKLNETIPARIDVIAVTQDNDQHQFDWIQNAIEG